MNHHPFPTVHQHTPTTPFHTPILPHSEKTADVPYTYPPISLPHRFSTPILWQKEGIQLATLGIRTGASAERGRRDNHHATTCNQFYDFTVFLLLVLNPGLRPYPSSRWGQGTHVQQIVRKLPIKAGWRDAPLALQDLAVSKLQCMYLAFKNLKISSKKGQQLSES